MILQSLLKTLTAYKTVLKNTFYLSILEAVHVLIPFVALPYIIKTVGAENYGKVVFAQVVVLYFMGFVNFGIDTPAVKHVARNRDCKKRLQLIVGAVVALKGLLFCSGLVVFSVIVLLWDKARNDWPLFFAAYLICLTEIFFTPWFFQGIEKMFVITVVRGASMLLYIASLLLFLHQKDQYWLVPLLQSAALLVTAVYGFYYMCRKEMGWPVFPGYRFLKRLLKESFPFYLSRSSVSINNSIATLVIGGTLGNYEVAVYDLAQKLARAALIPVYMLTQAIYPHNARNRNHKFALQAFAGLLGISIAGLIILYFIAPFAVDFLGNGQLSAAVPLLRFFEIYILIGVCTVYCGTPLLVAWGYPNPFNHSVLISTGGLLLIYGVFWCTGVASLYYFAAALLLSELLILSYRIFYCFKYKIFHLNFIEGKKNA